MSNWSRKNFDDIEGKDGPVDGRFTRKYLDSKELGVSRFRYAANHHSAMGHRHREQEEAYVVTAGSGRMKLDDEIIDLIVGDVIRVAPETTRAFAAGPDGLELICVGGRKPPEGDGERVEGFWD